MVVLFELTGLNCLDTLPKGVNKVPFLSLLLMGDIGGVLVDGEWQDEW